MNRWLYCLIKSVILCVILIHPYILETTTSLLEVNLIMNLLFCILEKALPMKHVMAWRWEAQDPVEIVQFLKGD